GYEPSMAPLHETNSLLGETTEEVNKVIGKGPTKVVQVPGHDTACALAALPRINSGSAFMSCATGVLVGVGVESAVLTKVALELGFTNEGTAEGKYRLQKNNMGLWLLQQSKREWEGKGEGITYEEEAELVEASDAFRSFIDPDD